MLSGKFKPPISTGTNALCSLHLEDLHHHSVDGTQYAGQAHKKFSAGLLQPSPLPSLHEEEMRMAHAAQYQQREAFQAISTLLQNNWLKVADGHPSSAELELSVFLDRVMQNHCSPRPGLLQDLSHQQTGTYSTSMAILRSEVSFHLRVDSYTPYKSSKRQQKY